jgi:hypothetical protein
VERLGATFGTVEADAERLGATFGSVEADAQPLPPSSGTLPQPAALLTEPRQLCLPPDAPKPGGPHMKAGLFVPLAATLLACSTPSLVVDQPVAPVPSASAASARPLVAALVDAGPPAPEKPPRQAILNAGYAPDGTLVVVKDDAVVTYAPDGKSAREPILASELVLWRSTGSFVVTAGEDARILTVNPLREVYRGHGRSLQDSDAIVQTTAGDPERDLGVAVVPPDGSTVKILSPLPKGEGARVGSIGFTTDDRFAVVTADVPTPDGNSTGAALAYDLTSGHAPVPALPGATNFGMQPMMTLEGDHEVGFRGDEVVVIDLATGATLHRAPFRCRHVGEDYHSRGNPKIDPAGHHLLATCDDDGVLFDYPSLRRVRTYSRLVPGCDNGFFLPGHFSDGGATFTIEGCGGESRLLLATGKYLCGDSDGLMGAPYEMGLDPRMKGRPAAAIGVPVCHSQEEREHALWRVSERFALESTAAGNVIVGPGHARIPVPESTVNPAVSPDESRFVTSDGVHVVEHAIRSGAVVRTVVP